MKVDGEMISERKDEDGKDEHGNWKRWEAGDHTTLSLDKSFTQSFNYVSANIPVNIDIWEDDGSSADDHIGITKANLTYDYNNDQWKWAYDSGNNWWKNEKGEKANDRKNPNITIGDGGEQTFTEEYRNDDGDTDVTIKISWKE